MDRRTRKPISEIRERVRVLHGDDEIAIADVAVTRVQEGLQRGMHGGDVSAGATFTTIDGTLTIREGEQVIMEINDLHLLFPNGRKVPFNWTSAPRPGVYSIHLNEDPEA
jgi:hypothetical protein